MQLTPGWASRVFLVVALAVLLPRCGTEPTEFGMEPGAPEDVTGQQDARGDAMESAADARSDAALPDASDLSDAPDSDDGRDVEDDTGAEDDAADSELTDTEAPNGTLGARCSSDSDCPSNSWCSDVPGFERCAPRVFGGTADQMDFVFVPSGTFLQGTPGATDEERPYSATITRNYFVSRTEVTQGQWKAATGVINPSYFQNTTCTNGSCRRWENANDNGPVDNVTWFSTLAYANWLSTNEGLSACYTLTPSWCADAVTGWATGDTACRDATFVGLNCTGYRLLTESEWERAARGGTTSTHYWGEATDTATVGLNAWFNSNSGNRTQAVGGKQANAYGLFDMSGNVVEWVWDWVYGSASFNYPSGSATDYLGPPSGSYRGVRGGTWDLAASRLGSADRFAGPPGGRVNNFVGFRLARTAN